MAEMISIPKEQLERLHERTRKLALEKSYLQLVNNLMNSLSTEPGLGNTVEAILRLILDNIGGTNVAIYYLMDSTIHYADVYGEKKILETVDDHLVRQAFEEKQSFEEVRDFVDTKMLTPEFTKASYWAFPLMVGERMIGAIKMEGMLMAAMEVRTQLQPFINYAALVLKNEIESDSRLMQAYDQIRRANEELKKSADALRRANEGLEAQVTDRTVELRRANEQLQFELTERKRAEEALRESEKRVRQKLDAILSPETDIEALELSDIIDSEKVQKLMDEFYRLTNVGIGIIDLHGNVLVGTGWQDICTKFHRVNPESCQLCIESDLELSRNVPVGTFKQYRCKNNMWDIATPIMLGDKHVGNIFLGQFLFDDETPDYEAFRQQAHRYGFNEEEYLAALDKVPRWSHQKVDAAMSFYTAFAGMIGNLSYANIKLASALGARRRVEETLRKSAEEIHDLYNRAPCGYHSLDSEGVFARINDTELEWLGYTRDEVVGKKRFPDVISKRSQKTYQDNFAQFKVRGWVRDLEFEMVRKDGTILPVFLSASAVKDTDGNYVMSRATVYDTTELKRAEAALRETESRYRIVADNTYDWEFWISPDGQFLYTSPSCERVTGHTADEFFREPSLLQGIIHPQDLERFMLHRQQVMKEMTSDEIEFRILHANGSVRNIGHVCQPVFDEQGRYLGKRGSNRDITERKRAEEALRDSEERYRDLYENAPNANFSIGVDGLIRRANRRAGELLGHAVEELVGRPVMELYADTAHGKEKATQVLHRFRAGETVRDQELEMQKADGNAVWISLTVDAVRDAQGRVVESRSMVVDITERKRVENIMQARIRLLEFANSCSMDELLTATLDEIEALTGSKIGFYHFLDPDQRTLSLQSWSTNTLKTMCTAAGKGRHYDVAQAGVWVDCIRERGPVIHNDYASLPHRKGMPEGHAPVIREVVVPILRGGLIKAIIGVGNKSRDYDNTDSEILSQLGDLSWDVVERKRAEEALKQAEEKYRGIFENAVEGIFQSTPEGRYLDANPALARIHGHDSPQELIASVIDIRRQHYVNPGDRTEFQKAMEQHGIVKDFETEQYRKDGSKIWVSVTARAVLGPDGQVRHYEGTVEDITERRRLAEALRDSEARYRAIVEAFEGLIYVCSQDYRVEFMNEELITRTGYDATGELCYKTLHERDSICPWCVNERVFKGETVRWEVKSPKDERWYYVVNTPIYRPDGRMSKQAMIMDITERKKVEEALRKTNETLRATLEAAPVAIFDLDTEGRVKSLWNAAAEELLGWRRDEVIGRFLPSVREENKEEFARFREWMRTGKRMMGQDVARRHKDGSLIEYSIYAAPEYDDDGKVLGNIAVLVDITDRKRAEEEIRRLNQELEQRVKDRTAELEAANKELEAFAYSVSHDLRAPLRHIDGFVELLQKRTATALDERGRQYLADISDSGRRMGMLIDDLLSFSRMRRHEMAKTQVDLGSLVQEVVKEVQPEVGGRDIRWHITDLPVVTGDRAVLRIVLVNLISNALKFTRPREQAEIEIGCLSDRKTETVVFVRDNGVGFDMNYADKLFGVFQRLHRVDEFEGTGIGLANVHRIIGRHGGRTWAVGKVNHGATFFFSLPQE